MKRDELLTKLSAELAEWPAGTDGDWPSEVWVEGWQESMGMLKKHGHGPITKQDWMERREELAAAHDESALSQALKGQEPGRIAGLKFDAGKPRMELLIQGMPRALEAVGQVLTFGAAKYSAHSWKHVEDNHNRYWAAKSRHELARAKGEERDSETGLLHLAHEACNALFLLELALMEGEA